MRTLLDYDAIDVWAPLLGSALAPVVPNAVRDAIARSKPEFIEDAIGTLLSLASRSSVIDATLSWLRSNAVLGYHGSRLTTDDVAAIRSHGLIPLAAADRRPRLKRALSRHPRWSHVAHKLDSEIERHGAGGRAGAREGQVHLTVSKAGLTEDFNHYLTHGAEFDYHVAHSLLDEEGAELLTTDGIPTLVTVVVPGADALAGTHFHFSVEDMLQMGETPNLVSQFLSAWAYRLAKPSFQSRTLKIDCGIRFRAAVPAKWIRSVESPYNVPRRTR